MLEVKNICNHSFISNWLNSNSIVIDLGLNHGEFAKGISSFYGCKIFGVEPNPALFNKMPFMSGLEAYNLAISGTEGVVDIFANQSIDYSIMFNEDDGSRIIKVHSTTLEKFLNENNVERVGLLKIDIEGAEISLFNSTKDDILKKAEQITVEFHDFMDKSLLKDVRPIIARMEGLGFYRKNFSRNNGDVLFINEKFHKLSLFDKLMLNTQKFTHGIHRKLHNKFN